jgi:glycyl-tRNA synthetase beta chain
VIEAAISTSFDDLLDVQHRIDALREAKEWQDFQSIVIAFKRAMNILRGASYKKEVNPSLFTESSEKNLFQSFFKAEERIGSHLNKRDYPSGLLEMTQLKRPIDEFFDQVMVMVEDEAIRNNRLALLDEIGQLFLRIADFSKLT